MLGADKDTPTFKLSAFTVVPDNVPLIMPV